MLEVEVSAAAAVLLFEGALHAGRGDTVRFSVPYTADDLLGRRLYINVSGAFTFSGTARLTGNNSGIYTGAVSIGANASVSVSFSRVSGIVTISAGGRDWSANVQIWLLPHGEQECGEEVDAYLLFDETLCADTGAIVFSTPGNASFFAGRQLYAAVSGDFSFSGIIYFSQSFNGSFIDAAIPLADGVFLWLTVDYAAAAGVMHLVVFLDLAVSVRLQLWLMP